MSVGKRVFSKMDLKIFLKLLTKLGCLRVKTDSQIFGTKFRFEENAKKHCKDRGFLDYAKKYSIE